jgi:hypothetical protein
MTFNILMLAGGLLAAGAFAGIVARLTRSRSKQITTDQLSGDWLAQARSREEHPW